LKGKLVPTRARRTGTLVESIGGRSERNLEKDAISGNDIESSLAFRDECRSGWCASWSRTRFRSFSGTIVDTDSRESGLFDIRLASPEAGEAPHHTCPPSGNPPDGGSVTGRYRNPILPRPP